MNLLPSHLLSVMSNGRSYPSIKLQQLWKLRLYWSSLTLKPITTWTWVVAQMEGIAWGDKGAAGAHRHSCCSCWNCCDGPQPLVICTEALRGERAPPLNIS